MTDVHKSADEAIGAARPTPGDGASGPVQTPCIGVCRLDAQGFCMGCLRSLEEISTWSRVSPDAQRRILAAVAERRAARAR